MRKWRILQSHIAFETPYFRIRQDRCQLPDDRIVEEYNVMESPDIVMVVPYTVEGDFVLVEQYKHGIGEICLELPAGMSEGGDPRAEAARELTEETGYAARVYISLGTFIPNPTRAVSRMHLFLGLEAYPHGPQQLDPNEEITVRRLSPMDALAAVRGGRIQVVGSIMAVYMALDYLHRADLLPDEEAP